MTGVVRQVGSGRLLQFEEQPPWRRSCCWDSSLEVCVIFQSTVQTAGTAGIIPAATSLWWGTNETIYRWETFRL